jgi:Na+/proline symporter
MLWAILTLGLYTLVWTYRTHEEIKSRSGEGVGGVIGLVIWLIFPPATFFLIPSEVRTLHRQEGEQSPVRGWTGLWILLPFAGVIIWFAGVQNALNRFWSTREVRTAAVDEPFAG